MILRVLAAALLSMFQRVAAVWRARPHTTFRRPAHGPAHPWAHAHVKAYLPERPRPCAVSRARPARVPPPPHILALLASAPEVEPEFAPKRHPARIAPLAAHLCALAVRVRIYNPKPAPAVDEHPPRPSGVSLAQRLSRAVSEVHEWLAFDSPPPAARH